MKEYVCKVYWERCGEVRVQAETMSEAALKALEAPLPVESEYVSDSISCDPNTDVQPIL
jgi:hypothetical protein